MCKEHYHEVYCPYCLRTVGTASTGRRYYCLTSRKGGYCTIEDYEVCKQKRTMAPQQPEKGKPDIYEHACPDRFDLFSRDALTWVWRDLAFKILVKLRLRHCDL